MLKKEKKNIKRENALRLKKQKKIKIIKFSIRKRILNFPRTFLILRPTPTILLTSK